MKVGAFILGALLHRINLHFFLTIAVLQLNERRLRKARRRKAFLWRAGISFVTGPNVVARLYAASAEKKAAFGFAFITVAAESPRTPLRLSDIVGESDFPQQSLSKISVSSEYGKIPLAGFGAQSRWRLAVRVTFEMTANQNVLGERKSVPFK